LLEEFCLGFGGASGEGGEFEIERGCIDEVVFERRGTTPTREHLVQTLLLGSLGDFNE